MDEHLRRLRRKNDPESRRRLGRELMRSGIINQHIDDFCLLAEYLNALENSDDLEDQEISINERHLIFRKLVRCMTPLNVFALMREDDEGASHVEGVYTSRESARKDLCNMFYLSIDMRRDYLDEDEVNDFLYSYQQKDYEAAMSLINHTVYGSYWIQGELLHE